MTFSASFGNDNNGFQAGAVYGPVSFQLLPGESRGGGLRLRTSANYGPTLERPETPPPPPSIVIPFTRHADFVEVILDQLCQRCAGSGSQTALVGLGGVG